MLMSTKVLAKKNVSQKGSELNLDLANYFIRLMIYI